MGEEQKMAIIKPFKAVRPANEYVKMVAELPYDVMNRFSNQPI